MKLVKLLSVAALTLIVTACGSAQPYNNYGYGLNSFSQFSNNNQVGGVPAGSVPILSGNQIIGYRARVPLISLQTLIPQYQVSSVMIPSNVSVNAGEKIVVDLSQSRYQVYQTQCLMGTVSIVTNLRQSHAIPSAELFLNGQLIQNGSIAQSSGVIQFRPILPPLSATCSVYSYRAVMYNAVYKESCFTANGQPMNCP